MASSLVVLLLAPLHSLSARADDDTDLSEYSETKLETEFEAQDAEQLQVDHQYAQEEAKTTVEEMKQVKREASELKAKNEQIAARIRLQNETVENNKKAVAQARHELERLQIKLVNQRKISDGLKERNTNLKQRRQQVRQDLTGVKAELAKLQRESSQLETQIASADKLLKKAKEQRAQMVAQARILKAKNAKKMAALKIRKMRLAKAGNSRRI